MTDTLTRRVGFQRGDDPALLMSREWLVTNGLGGYACGSLGGALTRRFHGLLIAALPTPLGRTMMLNQIGEELRSVDGERTSLTGREPISGELELPISALESFTLEDGLPVWRYAWQGAVLEKRVLMPHVSNTTVVIYRLHAAPRGALTLRLTPSFEIRRHEGELAARIAADTHGNVRFPYALRELLHGFELYAGDPYPPLSFTIRARSAPRFCHEPNVFDVLYRIERSRGYDFHGPLFVPGYYDLELQTGDETALLISTDPPSSFERRSAYELLDAERSRRAALVQAAHPALHTGFGAELVLAADQFVIVPSSRNREDCHGDLRSVIAGYHWFTDWGRDTMIGLEGLTLLSGRHRAAREILITFAQHTRNGLIPNLFPEGGTEGLYHTADATLWLFHATSRYETLSGDESTRRSLMPTLLGILDAHLRGTDFGIGVDPEDGLLRQGADGYQLTWMDAKVDGWVVTPRRGKAVELNALFFNALRLMGKWLERDDRPEDAERFREIAERVREAFNRRFWYESGGYLYDVIDGSEDAPAGRDDPAFRPNQLLAISLPHAVLEPKRWKRVVDKVHELLLTPAGLRSLAPGHPDYKPRYDGDLRSRDAAYHQGTVWAWLIGPFFDAWSKVYPDDHAGARALVTRFDEQLSAACVGSISEIFDAEAPYWPRGCVAQAWSVAEVLRTLASCR